MIREFSGKYRFLSNFYPCWIRVEGIEYPTVEHAFQAAKTKDELAKRKIAQASTPGKAKRMAGPRGTLITDFDQESWDQKKINVMQSLLYLKFENEHLRKALLATGDQLLVEGNNWGDRFWGKVNGEGENWLGRLLMTVRQDIRDGAVP